MSKLSELTLLWIRRTIMECDGNVNEAARVLGVSRWTIYRAVARYEEELWDSLDSETAELAHFCRIV